jgi:hypothetical protein
MQKLQRFALKKAAPAQCTDVKEIKSVKPRAINRILLDEAPGDRFDFELLVRERHLDAPTIRAEPPLFVGRRNYNLHRGL